MTKTIRSHKERVKRAKELIETDAKYSGERISIIDREAFVEFFLLEDIVALYEKRLDSERSYNPQSKAGERARGANIEKFEALLNVFRSAIETAKSMIDSGNYTQVRKAIPEGALMVCANSVKYLPYLKKIAEEMNRDLSDERFLALGASYGLDESMEEQDAHDENVRRVKGYDAFYPDSEQVNEVQTVTDNSAKRRRTKTGSAPKTNL